jgi:hypothetical protein
MGTEKIEKARNQKPDARKQNKKICPLVPALYS